MPDNSERSLTDADIEALSDALLARAKREFYTDLGRGFWALAWRGAVVGLLAVAAYGAVHR